MWRVPDADNNVKRTSWQTSYLTSAPLMPTVSMPGAAGSFCPGTSMRTPVYILNGSWGMVLILSFPVIYLSEMMGGTEPTGPWVDEVTPHCDTHTGPIRVGLAQNTKAHKQKKVLHSKMCAKKQNKKTLTCKKCAIHRIQGYLHYENDILDTHQIMMQFKIHDSWQTAKKKRGDISWHDTTSQALQKEHILLLYWEKAAVYSAAVSAQVHDLELRSVLHSRLHVRLQSTEPEHEESTANKGFVIYTFTRMTNWSSENFPPQ